MTPEALVGSLVADRFELVAFAGAGGMGRVYRARDRQTGATVAVKLLEPEGLELLRFEREAEALSSIDHPGVVRYLGHGAAADSGRWLAMEWLDGVDLAARLGEGTLSVPETLTLARGIADALAAAHARGVVHRDLKPGNLFLVGGRLDAVKLLDFGIARPPRATEITQSGTLVGTPAYMAPEQVRGGAMDARVDVYASGAVLFRCLTGAPPFSGPNQLAVLAKVLLEEPPSLRGACVEAPRELEALVARLLSKDPEGRPADGAELGRELAALSEGTNPVPSRRIPAAVGAQELRVASMVLCARGDASEEVTARELGVPPVADVVQRAIVARGGVVEPLARGAWIVTIPSALSPAEEATRAARCALALSAVRSGAPVVVATGRVLVRGVRRVGEVIDRAAEALAHHEASGVLVDEATAALLDARFRLGGDGAWRRLLGEDASATPVRTLLGKPAPCVGREAQLATLTAALASCEADAHPGVVLVTAPPGIGKTRLVHEWLRAAIAPRPDVAVLRAQGEPLRAGSALGMFAELVTRAAGVVESDGAERAGEKIDARVVADAGLGARDVAEMLREVAGAPLPREAASPALLAARADVTVMADAVRDAAARWLGALAAAHPSAVLLVEDVHWADAASLRLLRDAVSRLEDRPLLLLATGRPEARVAFADAFRDAGLVEIHLGPLSAAAAERLVRAALGTAASPEVTSQLARRAAGHPFHLEELVRAVAAGRGADALPDSVLGMVQVRLDALSGLPRRLLRAASVFGERFSSAGLAALLGDEVTDAELHATLAALTRLELLSVEPTSGPGPAEHRFRHALVRDAAYAMLADADAVRAHRRAAEWLELNGDRDPAVVAEHFVRGAAPERGLPFLVAAATQALRRQDLDRAADHARRAEALGPEGPIAATLRAVEAEILYWKGELGAAADRASDAVVALPRGGAAWFEAVSVASAAMGQLGRNDAVARWLDEVTRVASHDETRGAHVVALCRGLTQLCWAHHRGDLGPARAALDALAAGPATLSAYELGWVHRARGETAWVIDGDAGASLGELGESVEAFAAAHAARALGLTRVNAASLLGWSGDTDGALASLARARRDAAQVAPGFLASYAAAVEALVRTYAGEPGAEDRWREALAGVGGSPRLAFVARFMLGSLALHRGDLDLAVAEARQASALLVVDDLRAASLALEARALVRSGDLPAGLATSAQAEGVEASCRDLELTWGAAGLARAEALRAAGDEERARQALARVTARLSAAARTLPPEARARFWRRRHSNDEVAALAASLGLGIEG